MNQCRKTNTISRNHFRSHKAITIEILFWTHHTHKRYIYMNESIISIFSGPIFPEATISFHNRKSALEWTPLTSRFIFFFHIFFHAYLYCTRIYKTRTYVEIIIVMTIAIIGRAAAQSNTQLGNDAQNAFILKWK